MLTLALSTLLATATATPVDLYARAAVFRITWRHGPPSREVLVCANNPYVPIHNGAQIRLFEGSGYCHGRWYIENGAIRNTNTIRGACPRASTAL
ncbi:unnamed protein product [Cutaneotrichosporon oleaginosum]